MPRKRSLASIICWHFLRFVAPLKRRITRTSELSFNIRYPSQRGFPDRATP
jgi:hypothetical protein